VRFPAAVESALIAHAREVAPEECCGLLLGRDDAIVDAVPVNNVAEDRLRRYCIDPDEHFGVIRAARQLDLDVVGAYHSHPRSGAQPSPTDRAEAFSDFLFVIVGLGRSIPEIRAFRLEHGNFTPVPFVRVS
jgi:proteasome lid subunit RPN8/RPN11